MIEMMSNFCGPIRNRLVGATKPRFDAARGWGLGQLTSVMTGGSGLGDRQASMRTSDKFFEDIEKD